MVSHNSITEPATIAGWSSALEELHGLIAYRFSRSEVRERARRYLQGLLKRVERKNGWQLAEAIGEADPQGVQRLLNAAKWDADGVRDDVRGYVVQHLGDTESGVLIVDETGFLKKGDKSVGVAPQYTGTTGDTANAQVGVFLAYASGKGAAFIDRALYLPEEWTHDTDRSGAAGVPETITFATKVELARQLLERAIDAGVPARWVVADSFYGRSHGFRRWLEQKGHAYALMIPKTNAVRYQGRRERVERLAGRLPSDAWVSVPAEGSSSGRRPWEWTCLELALDKADGMRRWLVVRRSPDAPSDLAFYQAYGPQDTTIEKLVSICGSRWQIEECFAQAKGEVGLDQYEVRRWDAWHRYVTLCLLAHALLVVTQAAARCEEARVKRGPSTRT
jgi:SRSO17 transposase